MSWVVFTRCLLFIVFSMRLIYRVHKLVLRNATVYENGFFILIMFCFMSIFIIWTINPRKTNRKRQVLSWKKTVSSVLFHKSKNLYVNLDHGFLVIFSSFIKIPVIIRIHLMG